ncbi:MAG: BON domain-containing protein [Chitinivibrionales bacterium]|nr:BON domain-containing protein [Chitinivibrionales bacterium]
MSAPAKTNRAGFRISSLRRPHGHSLRRLSLSDTGRLQNKCWLNRLRSCASTGRARASNWRIPPKSCASWHPSMPPRRSMSTERAADGTTMADTAPNTLWQLRKPRPHRSACRARRWRRTALAALATLTVSIDPHTRAGDAGTSVAHENAAVTGSQSTADSVVANPPLEVYGRAFLVYSRLCDRPDTAGNDTRLRHVVDSILRLDPVVDHHRVHADVCRGIAYLSGTVSGRAQIRRAQELVERIDGITDVENTIRVARGVGPVGSDGTIEQRIYQYLEENWQPQAASRVRVSVTAGVATLRGEVPDSDHYADIVSAALSAGAESVRCRLTVTAAPDRGYGPRDGDTTGAPISWP